MQPLSGPLTEAELDRLDDFLTGRIGGDTGGKDPGIFCVSGLDGFLAAVVSGPRAVMPSAWLPAIWGDFEPVWEDMGDFEAVFGLMIRHMNAVSDTLMQRPHEYEPLFWEHETDGETALVVEDWCDGYVRAIELNANEWHSPEPELDIMLTPILAFGGELDRESLERLNDEEIDALAQRIPDLAREIHAFWRAWRGDPADQLSRPAPVRRASPRVGRNDPCPCGSGRKYKQCCLH